ncbi:MULTISPECIES: type 1 glutamine amidotransferase domain-containing protein [Paraburkholderia]|uniref:type 1 glutamine amidotransferase domain-containing protein n=1 Tax=Paraburkholderia TaxID=1822464 RepID=UPI00225C212C|nr:MULTISPECIES: type 1 glutamine amidotransferase domain-containing protein [Paraburkholderia]MCX4160038.1 thiJ/pfpI-family protein [Paraburkholderia megapolitana]MDN7155538.1 type 1 glutamine amidotransferase domain-containing protein [Paraburkholderia sp. CHISQ3]MDQ6492582.1 type 1 glutamine amidotransferase domain-containing protein [Paraburkholderia megapolitana]
MTANAAQCTTAHILMPLPSRDSDPSEVAVSWQILRARGHRVSFATPDGRPAECDPLMINGRGLDPWGWIPGLRCLPLVGLILRARRDARDAYAQLRADTAFQNPLRWDAIDIADFDGLLLAGGHRARGMREYLESGQLQAVTAACFAAEMPIAAICHGVLLAARSRRPDGRSVLYGLRTTALTWALEHKAASLTRFTRFWDPDYYRTYSESPGQPAGYMSVQQEVTRELARPEDFLDVPRDAPDYRSKTDGIARDSDSDERPAFVVRDGRYVSARWPGDVHRFAREYAELLEECALTKTQPRISS